MIMSSLLKLGWVEDIKFELLKGETITHVDVINDEEIRFTLAPSKSVPDGTVLKQFHYQDCCESVYIEDIVGDWDDIIGSPLTMAEEVFETSDDGVTGKRWGDDDWQADDSFTWTYYKLGTVKGYVTIRWYGTSNGYYSESVSLARVRDGK